MNQAFQQLVPYVLALADFRPGVRIPARVVDIDPQDLRIGLDLTLDFETLETGVTLPVFSAS
jgi:hypothetical protein